MSKSTKTPIVDLLNRAKSIGYSFAVIGYGSELKISPKPPEADEHPHLSGNPRQIIDEILDRKAEVLEFLRNATTADEFIVMRGSKLHERQVFANPIMADAHIAKFEAENEGSGLTIKACMPQTGQW